MFRPACEEPVTGDVASVSVDPSDSYVTAEPSMRTTSDLPSLRMNDNTVPWESNGVTAPSMGKELPPPLPRRSTIHPHRARVSASEIPPPPRTSVDVGLAFSRVAATEPGNIDGSDAARGKADNWPVLARWRQLDRAQLAWGGRTNRLCALPPAADTARISGLWVSAMVSAEDALTDARARASFHFLPVA